MAVLGHVTGFYWTMIAGFDRRGRTGFLQNRGRPVRTRRPASTGEPTRIRLGSDFASLIWIGSDFDATRIRLGSGSDPTLADSDLSHLTFIRLGSDFDPTRIRLDSTRIRLDPTLI